MGFPRSRCRERTKTSESKKDRHVAGHSDTAGSGAIADVRIRFRAAAENVPFSRVNDSAFPQEACEYGVYSYSGSAPARTARGAVCGGKQNFKYEVRKCRPVDPVAAFRMSTE